MLDRHFIAKIEVAMRCWGGGLEVGWEVGSVGLWGRYKGVVFCAVRGCMNCVQWYWCGWS